MNYYNEWDAKTADWLRELIKSGEIPKGYVDERSITDVTPSDLEGFTQCHFFAGIGGWPLALKMAGVPDDFRVWTGSPPCQPFSVAGKQKGRSDDRHLAPTFMRLVAQCRPPVIFGEQVAAAIGKHWLDDLLLELEREGYACGAAVLPACSVGAPHKRDRLFFGAHELGHANCERHYGVDALLQRPRQEKVSEAPQASEVGGLGNAALLCASNSDNRGVGSKKSTEQGETREGDGEADRITSTDVHYRPTNQNHGFWSDADWLGCRDGKFRPVESGTFPLADGIPARVGRLRGYGNAIVPQVAAEFVRAFLSAEEDLHL